MALKASFNRIGFLGRNYTLQKIYELRTYVVNPRDQRQFLDLSKEWMHLRTAHSKLIGYWTNELGSGINDMVHIWEYDSLKHRADVRQRLAGDPEWVGSYFSKILPWLQRQENDLLRCLPGTEVKDAPGSGWLLWHHNDLDNAAANPLKTDEASKFYVVQSKVLLPTPWSPLK
ncbi:NPS3B-like protein [Mya arenaria]|uniref:NPS3B-like protein n=1 Tax=Mya arenaria TaxID=6604 RepID=A0ABY7EWV9_MYAAR|nr:NPS3B-like protein [Mya arenaria]